MRQRWVWGVFIGVVLGSAIAFVASFPLSKARAQDRSTRAKRIVPGMTVAEVEGLLGGPVGNYTHPLRWGFGRTADLAVRPEKAAAMQSGSLSPPGTARLWVDEVSYLEIWFDTPGRVIFVFRLAGYSPPTILGLR